jgi:hypothetical protein
LSWPTLAREISGDPEAKAMRFLRFKERLSGVVKVEELLESLERRLRGVYGVEGVMGER